MRKAVFVCAGLILSLSVASCADHGPVVPEGSSDLILTAPAHALLDGSSGGSAEFYFLPPLVPSPDIVGTFNPNLLPAMEVCELDDSWACTGAPVATFGPGSAQVADAHYVISWDTNGPETAPLDPMKNYRIRVLLAGEVMGYMDVNPQDPSGTTPGEDIPGLYAFRLGETIPVKFWLSTRALCTSEYAYVIECISGAVLDESGGTLVLNQVGDAPLGVYLPPDGLPGDEHPPIMVVLERIDPDLFLQMEGEECIPFLDAPQWGPCFRITTYPELTDPLDYEATVSICVDPTIFEGIQGDQDDLVQIHRFATDGSGVVQGLQNVASTICSTSSYLGASLLDVPASGLGRYAALGVNAVWKWMGPQPLAAAHLGLGGLISSFSRFRWALPAQMVVESGDGSIVTFGESGSVSPTVRVVDVHGQDVAGATVHFSVLSDDGTVTPLEVTTGPDGLASGAWEVGSTLGDKQLAAWAFGLWHDPPPSHETTFAVRPDTVLFTATVIGAPAAVTPVSGDGQVGIVGEALTDPVVVHVVDENGTGVPGAEVVWTPSGSGSVTGSTTTDPGGYAEGTWTLAQEAGGNSLVVEAGGVSTTFTATGTPGAPAEVTPWDGADGQTATVGTALPNPLGVTVFDGYGNPVPGVEVVWSVAPADGTLTGDASTGPDGTAQASWTLGTTTGVQNATFTVAGLSFPFTATATPDEPYALVKHGEVPSGTVGETLDVGVTVVDRYENPVPGVPVEWSVTSGGGSIAGDGAAGPDGTSWATWTLGDVPGTNGALASAAGLEGAFNVEAGCLDGYGTATPDGVMGATEWICAHSMPFVANISGGSTDAEAYWMNDGSNLYFAVRVRQSTYDRSNSLRVDFDNDGDGIHEAGDDAIGFDADGGTFFDQYLTEKCSNSGQSGCGAADGSVDGAGASANDGTWTVYELSHPLAAGDPRDFFLSSGDPFGFFLTLRVGKGAQGNTQVPGFRDFMQTTVAGH